jgi:hypothetical protein
LYDDESGATDSNGPAMGGEGFFFSLFIIAIAVVTRRFGFRGTALKCRFTKVFGLPSVRRIEAE